MSPSVAFSFSPLAMTAGDRSSSVPPQSEQFPASLNDPLQVPIRDAKWTEPADDTIGENNRKSHGLYGLLTLMSRARRESESIREVCLSHLIRSATFSYVRVFII